MTNWKPMTEHKFPWNVERVLLAVYYAADNNLFDVIKAKVGEHGAFFQHDMMSVHERGYIPYAWCEDDSPDPGEPWPPMLFDYLTDPANHD